MFGANMGYQSKPELEVFKKWAWVPTKTSSQKWIIWKTYYQIAAHCNENRENLVKYQILTENEYLVWQIKHPEKYCVLPVRTGGVIKSW